MKLLTFSFIKPFLLIIFLFLSGCQSIDVRGQFVSDDAINEINTKKLNKDQVAELIGSPTYIPEYSPNNWYYIQRSQAKRAWFDPKVVEQRIVKISFKTDGKLIEAGLLSDVHEEDIVIEKNYTKTKGTEQNGIQKFVKNIGRFNKTTDGKRKKQKKQSQ